MGTPLEESLGLFFIEANLAGEKSCTECIRGRINSVVCKLNKSVVWRFWQLSCAEVSDTQFGNAQSIPPLISDQRQYSAIGRIDQLRNRIGNYGFALPSLILDEFDVPNDGIAEFDCQGNSRLHQSAFANPCWWRSFLSCREPARAAFSSIGFNRRSPAFHNCEGGYPQSDCRNSEDYSERRDNRPCRYRARLMRSTGARQE